MADATKRDHPTPVLEMSAAPQSTATWFRSILDHREVLVALAQKDFKVRYKRASFGVLWAVALPLVQSAVMIVVFSRITRAGDSGIDYMGYVLGGMVGWSYIAVTLPSATTAVVDGAGLTDKVWFPRALLVLAPMLANGVGMAISVVIVLPVQLIRGELDLGVVLLVPAVVLAFTLVGAASLVLSALYVSFRDIKFLVQAGLLVLFYATPVLYPPSFLGSIGDYTRYNPFTGSVNLFQRAFTDVPVDGVAVAVSTVTALVLLVAGVQLHRRNDRLFVDLL